MKLSNNRSLLLVDDEKDIRDVLELSLTDLGYCVFIAENGEEALDLFKRRRPEIVLTDIKMPGMDGIELLQRVKHECSDTEVIMLTGHGDTGLAIKSLKYEAIDFITKPINDDVLEVALRRAHDKIDTRKKLREYTNNLESLVQEKAEMQNHLSALGLMIGSISHGIKGLLTRLDAGLYEIKSAHRAKELERIEEGISIVEQTVGRIKKLILDILFYAKERDLKKEKIDLCNFAGQIADVVEPRTRGEGVTFVRDFDASQVEVVIDADCIRSALINILENAVDACCGDASKTHHQIQFCARVDNSHVIFEIRDDGIGMDQDTCENIFNLFFSAKGKKGTGLGLFIADKIVKQHGGEILVESKLGEETIFVVRLPMQA